MRRVRQKKIVVARKDIVDAGPAGMNEQSRGDAAARRHAAKNETLLDVIRIAIPRGNPGGLLRRVVDQPAHLLRVQICRAPGSSGGAENSANAVRALVSFKYSEPQGDANSRSDVIAEPDGPWIGTAHRSTAVTAASPTAASARRTIL